MYNLPKEGFVRIPQIIGDKKANPPVVGVCPFSKAQLWKLVKEGKFPSPIKISTRVTAWRVEDVRKFIEEVGY